jgi:hypothetical protein
MIKKADHRLINGRNWPLTIISIILIGLDVTIIILVCTNIHYFGPWGLVVGIGAVSSIFFCYKAIRTNDPVWLLLDLILPS